MKRKVIYIISITGSAIVITYAFFLYSLIYSLKVDYDREKFIIYMKQVEKRLEKKQKFEIRMVQYGLPVNDKNRVNNK